MEIGASDAINTLLESQTGAIQARIAIMAAHKVMKIEKAMGRELVALLDPNLGTQLDRRA